CERCTVRGVYKGKIVFLKYNCEQTTNYSFKAKLDPYHHVGVSPLEKLGVGMVTAFSLDYMHLVLLGVMKRTLWRTLWRTIIISM
ncbi:hypothetical protein EAI_12488, partial [Harpegnathos saltator]